MAEITLTRVDDLAAWEVPWRALETRAEASVFQGWTWTGCLAAERFPAPVMIEAHVGGRLAGLALCNARPLWPRMGRLSPLGLHLGETGDAARDAVFIEHNGPLLERGQQALLQPMLQAALGAALPGGAPATGRTLALSGVGDAVLRAAIGTGAACRVRQSRPAPCVDLRVLPGGDYLASLGSSTRYQLRRSRRYYAAIGPVTLRRAAHLAEAQDYFERLMVLHQHTWRARNQPGAFADGWMRHFHRTLIARGFGRGEVELLRVAAGEQAIGYLYNLVGAGGLCVGNYQGGFDYATAGPHGKPGLTCHALAIEHYRDEGRHVYDLLAGESRYKTSLANREAQLHWLSLTPGFSLPDLAHRAGDVLRQARAAIRRM